jgi:hypothetical protein
VEEEALERGHPVQEVNTFPTTAEGVRPDRAQAAQLVAEAEIPVNRTRRAEIDKPIRSQDGQSTAVRPVE